MDHLVKAVNRRVFVEDELLSRYTDYFAKALSGVSFPWVKMFKDAPLSTLIDVPLSHIPDSVYGTTRNWLDLPPVELEDFSAFVLRAFDQILLDLEGGGGGDDSKSQVGMFVALAIVLRCKPEALAPVLPILRQNPKYQGHDKLPVTVWMLAQASKVTIYVLACIHGHITCYHLSQSVVRSVGYIPQSMDLILQFVEEILSRPRAPAILVDGALREGEPLIPLTSFEILGASRIPCSRRKSRGRGSFTRYARRKQRREADVHFSLRSARKGIVTGNPVLAEEATSIAIWENLEASVALLKELVGGRWVFRKLSKSPRDTLTLNQTMESFRRKNKRAIAEGGASASLYKES
ncbi:hypothetical protein Rs2_39844 [Raphanus sativus]|nr:hypothetical protein Rs2_39844 [Raphanus sativus]